MAATSLWDDVRLDQWATIASPSTLGWLIGALALIAILPAAARKIRGQSYPVVNPSPAWDIFNFSSMFDYVKHGSDRVAEGFQKVCPSSILNPATLMPSPSSPAVLSSCSQTSGRR